MFCLKTDKREPALTLLTRARVDLDMKDRWNRHYEDIARDHNTLDLLNLLGTFTGPRFRMIQRDSLLSRQSGTMSSLQSLSRDVVLTSLITNNSQERKVESLVDRLGEDITNKAREVLLRVTDE